MSELRHGARRAGQRGRKLKIEQVVDKEKLNHSSCKACDERNASHPHVVFGAYLADGACIGIIACPVHREHVFRELSHLEGVNVDPRGDQELPADEKAALDEYVSGAGALK